MAIVIRTSSTSAGGAANATSLGGYTSASAPSTSNGAFFDDVSQAQNDAGHTDYRCLFIYNNGSTVMNSVVVSATNYGGGSTVTVALSSTATGAFASYNTAVIGTETTAPSVTGSYASSVTIGTLNAGEVRAVWLKRVTGPSAGASTGDNVNVVASYQEVIV